MIRAAALVTIMVSTMVLASMLITASNSLMAYVAKNTEVASLAR